MKRLISGMLAPPLVAGMLSTMLLSVEVRADGWTDLANGIVREVGRRSTRIHYTPPYARPTGHYYHPYHHPSSRYYSTRTVYLGHGGSLSVPRNVIPNSIPATRLGSRAQGIVLINPQDSPGTVHYMLNGRAMSLAPGYTQRLGMRVSRTIEFDRGRGFGRARYVLSYGTYEFGVTDRGWGLLRQTYNITIQNTSGDNSFHYLVDDRPTILAPGRSQTHRSRFAVVIRFDRGDGGKAVRKTLRSGLYRVGIEPGTNRWDLMPSGRDALVVNALTP